MGVVPQCQLDGRGTPNVYEVARAFIMIHGELASCRSQRFLNLSYIELSKLLLTIV